MLYSLYILHCLSLSPPTIHFFSFITEQDKFITEPFLSIQVRQFDVFDDERAERTQKKRNSTPTVKCLGMPCYRHRVFACEIFATLVRLVKNLSRGTRFSCVRAPACSARKKHALLQTAATGLSFTPCRPVPNSHLAAISAKKHFFSFFVFKFLDLSRFLTTRFLNCSIFTYIDYPPKKTACRLNARFQRYKPLKSVTTAGRSLSEF